MFSPGEAVVFGEISLTRVALMSVRLSTFVEITGVGVPTLLEAVTNIREKKSVVIKNDLPEVILELIL